MIFLYLLMLPTSFFTQSFYLGLSVLKYKLFNIENAAINPIRKHFFFVVPNKFIILCEVSLLFS